MKYAHLKQERDEAVARAVEAERLSNVDTIRQLEAQLEADAAELEAVQKELSGAYRHIKDLEHRLAYVTMLARDVSDAARGKFANVQRRFRSYAIIAGDD